MADLLDREFQFDVLRRVADDYPQATNIARAFGGQEANRLAVNLAYLNEHELLDVNWFNDVAKGRRPVSTKITARGLDFLANDGGLSAVLGVVTVRLHEDSVKALLIDRIEKSGAEDSIRGKLIQKIKELPADAMSSLTMKALEAGLQQMPNVVTTLQKLLGP